jgi:hypothetical protein
LERIIMTRMRARSWTPNWPRFGRATAPAQDFALVRRSTNLHDLARVERHLPDILGRAMARGWIDADFGAALMDDPKGLLARYDVFLPDHVTLQTEVTETGRQRIVVYETETTGSKRRVMYLQLVMMAGQ